MKHRDSGRMARIWSRLSRSERRYWDIAVRSPIESVATAARRRSDRIAGWMHTVSRRMEGAQ